MKKTLLTLLSIFMFSASVNAQDINSLKEQKKMEVQIAFDSASTINVNLTCTSNINSIGEFAYYLSLQDYFTEDLSVYRIPCFGNNYTHSFIDYSNKQEALAKVKSLIVYYAELQEFEHVSYNAIENCATEACLNDLNFENLKPVYNY